MNLIASAFIKAKKAFGPALKAKENAHFKSRYADLAMCLDAVDEALLENGIALIQETFMDDTGVTVETVFLHESGEIIRGGKLHVPASKQDPQGYGSALSYARRYSLMTACGIAAEDDDGNAATAPAKAPAKPTAASRAITDVPVLIRAMEATTSIAALQTAFASAWKSSGHDEKVKAAYDRLKTIMEAAQ